MKHSKTGWIITIIALLVIACGGIAIKLWPRTVPVEECSPVYKEYAGKPGIEVSFVKDYRINDTTFVDVTMIHATTDSAWVCLCEEFIPPEYPYEFKEPLLYGQAVSQWTVSKTAPHIKVNLSSQNNYDLLVLSSKIKSVCIFHTENKEETLAIIAYQINELPTH